VPDLWEAAERDDGLDGGEIPTIDVQVPEVSGEPALGEDEAIEDPAGGWWGPVSEVKGGRPIRPRWSRNWDA